MAVKLPSMHQLLWMEKGAFRLLSQLMAEGFTKVKVDNEVYAINKVLSLKRI